MNVVILENETLTQTTATHVLTLASHAFPLVAHTLLLAAHAPKHKYNFHCCYRKVLLQKNV